MVHKKYLKIKGKTYGPYYYESYRENGKIKKRYIRAPGQKERRRVKNKLIKKEKKFITLYILIASILLFTTVAYYIAPTYIFEGKISSKPELFMSPLGASYGGTGSVNLSIWDDMDDGMIKRSGNNVNFYTNYTDVLGNQIDDSGGNCQIRYNIGQGFGSFEDMSYSSPILLWGANRTFNYIGEHVFEVECTSSFGGITLNNTFFITNTPPIFHTYGAVTNGKEDTPIIYNFSANATEIDANDLLNFAIQVINGPLGNVSASLYPWISIDSQIGVMAINATKDNETGDFVISIWVSDILGEGEGRQFTFNVLPVNDAPVFANLENKNLNMSELFDYGIIARDEENNFPLHFNISFLSCETAQWSTRGNTNCELFNSAQYIINESNGTIINISFTPSKNDVGDYTINFSVMDTNNLVLPYNAFTSVIVNFSVINTNDPPYFTYMCDNERTATEDSAFICYINASDGDEINNLTFISDNKWFLDLNAASVNITTGFKGSIKVGFVPTDENVGNWAINITVRDTGSPIRANSTIINFSVENINDSVNLGRIENITAFTSNTYYAIYINATDDDLLIPYKGVYNELLSFSSDNSCVGVTSQGVISGTNKTAVLIDFNPNCLGGGNYNVTISTNDLSGNTDKESFIITVEGNSPPVWNSPEIIHKFFENSPFYLNFSENASDADGDSITFFYEEDGEFPSFSLDEETGVIDFAPVDGDIGQHILNISAFDGKTRVHLIFNFTVINFNDAPVIELPLNGNGISINSTTLYMNTSEDMEVLMGLFVRDEDFKIPFLQRDFYDESLSIDLNFSGPNENLFSFGEPAFLAADRLLYSANFTPRKSDVGLYNITLNVSDASGASSFIEFNLNILEINHPPIFTNLANQSAFINGELYYDINAIDLEEGNDTEGTLTYSYRFLNGTDFINHDENIFNTKTGVLNATFDFLTEGAKYYLSVTVNDSTGLQNTGYFWIFVYDSPYILAPPSGYIFNLKENNQSNLTFRANHTIGNELNYKFYIGGEMRHDENYSGDGSIIRWQFTPTFNDETYGLFGNLTLMVSVPVFQHLNASLTWSMNITHTSAPMQFIKDVGDKQGNYGKEMIINLSEHFYDADSFDPHYNESLRFIIKSSAPISSITYNVNNWILSLSASTALVEILNITGSDLDGNGKALTNATSNNFKIEFTEPTEVQVPMPVPVPVSGGGGGGTTEKLISLKIIMPDAVSLKKGEKIMLPVSVINDGSVILNGIDLSGLMAKDGLIREDFKVAFSKSFFSTLKPGAHENLTLSVNTTLDEPGLYELTVNGKVQSPKYLDWGKIYIKVQEGSTLIERLVFTEEFIVENPECIELKELVDESREYLLLGNVGEAEDKLNEAVNSCKEAISQESLISPNRIKIKLQDEIFIYLLIATIIAIVFGISYYTYQRIMFKRVMAGVEKMSSNIGPSESFS